MLRFQSHTLEAAHPPHSENLEPVKLRDQTRNLQNQIQSDGHNRDDKLITHAL